MLEGMRGREEKAEEKSSEEGGEKGKECGVERRRNEAKEDKMHRERVMCPAFFLPFIFFFS